MKIKIEIITNDNQIIHSQVYPLLPHKLQTLTKTFDGPQPILGKIMNGTMVISSIKTKIFGIEVKS